MVGNDMPYQKTIEKTPQIHTGIQTQSPFHKFPRGMVKIFLCRSCFPIPIKKKCLLSILESTEVSEKEERPNPS